MRYYCYNTPQRTEIEACFDPSVSCGDRDLCLNKLQLLDDHAWLAGVPKFGFPDDGGCF